MQIGGESVMVIDTNGDGKIEQNVDRVFVYDNNRWQMGSANVGTRFFELNEKYIESVLGENADPKQVTAEFQKRFNRLKCVGEKLIFGFKRDLPVQIDEAIEKLEGQSISDSLLANPKICRRRGPHDQLNTPRRTIDGEDQNGGSIYITDVNGDNRTDKLYFETEVVTDTKYDPNTGEAYDVGYGTIIEIYALNSLSDIYHSDVCTSLDVNRSGVEEFLRPTDSLWSTNKTE